MKLVVFAIAAYFLVGLAYLWLGDESDCSISYLTWVVHAAGKETCQDPDSPEAQAREQLRRAQRADREPEPSVTVIDPVGKLNEHVEDSMAAWSHAQNLCRDDTDLTAVSVDEVIEACDAIIRHPKGPLVVIPLELQGRYEHLLDSNQSEDDVRAEAMLTKARVKFLVPKLAATADADILAAIDLRPNNVAGYNTRLKLLRIAPPTAAVKSAQQATLAIVAKLRPKDGRPWLEIALLHGIEGKQPEALAALDRVDHFELNSLRDATRALVYQLGGDEKRAQSVLDAALRSKEPRFEVHLVGTLVSALGGRHGEAIDRSDAAIRAVREGSNRLVYVGDQLERVLEITIDPADKPLSVEGSEALTTSSAELMYLHKWRALSYLVQEENQHALSELYNAVGLFQHSAELWMWRAVAQQRVGNTSEALADCRRAQAVSGANPGGACREIEQGKVGEFSSEEILTMLAGDLRALIKMWPRMYTDTID